MDNSSVCMDFAARYGSQVCNGFGSCNETIRWDGVQNIMSSSCVCDDGWQGTGDFVYHGIANETCHLNSNVVTSVWVLYISTSFILFVTHPIVTNTFATISNIGKIKLSSIHTAGTPSASTTATAPLKLVNKYQRRALWTGLAYCFTGVVLGAYRLMFPRRFISDDLLATCFHVVTRSAGDLFVSYSYRSSCTRLYRGILADVIAKEKLEEQLKKLLRQCTILHCIQQLVNLVVDISFYFSNSLEMNQATIITFALASTLQMFAAHYLIVGKSSLKLLATVKRAVQFHTTKATERTESGSIQHYEVLQNADTAMDNKLFLIKRQISVSVLSARIQALVWVTMSLAMAVSKMVRFQFGVIVIGAVVYRNLAHLYHRWSNRHFKKTMKHARARNRDKRSMATRQNTVEYASESEVSAFHSSNNCSVVSRTTCVS